MTSEDTIVAVQRLTAWLRDYGDKSSAAFTGDLAIVLLIAKEAIVKAEQEDC